MAKSTCTSKLFMYTARMLVGSYLLTITYITWLFVQGQTIAGFQIQEQDIADSGTSYLEIIDALPISKVALKNDLNINLAEARG